MTNARARGPGDARELFCLYGESKRNEMTSPRAVGGGRADGAVGRREAVQTEDESERRGENQHGVVGKRNRP